MNITNITGGDITLSQLFGAAFLIYFVMYFMQLRKKGPAARSGDSDVEAALAGRKGGGGGGGSRNEGWFDQASNMGCKEVMFSSLIFIGLCQIQLPIINHAPSMIALAMVMISVFFRRVIKLVDLEVEEVVTGSLGLLIIIALASSGVVIVTQAYALVMGIYFV